MSCIPKLFRVACACSWAVSLVACEGANQEVSYADEADAAMGALAPQPAADADEEGDELTLDEDDYADNGVESQDDWDGPQGLPLPEEAQTPEPEKLGLGAPTVRIRAGAVEALLRAVNEARQGDVIQLQKGHFDMKGKKLVLSASNVAIVAALGTVLDFGATASADNGVGLEVRGNANTIRGLTIAHAADNGIHISGSDNVVRQCTLHDNFDTGLQISGPQSGKGKAPSNNQIINCDSFDNHDTHPSQGGDADGFAAKINIGVGNRFVGCVAHDNSDDGWDLFPKVEGGSQPVLIEDCVAYHNGFISGKRAGNGNGFELGGALTVGAAHVVKNSLAFDNPKKGFDQNHNRGRAVLDHCTAINNGTVNFGFDDSKASEFGADITNSVATGGFEQSAGVSAGNFTNAKAASFVSLDPSLLRRTGKLGVLSLRGFGELKAGAAGVHF